MTFTIKLSDAPGTTALAKESTRTGWRDLELQVRYPGPSGADVTTRIGPAVNGQIDLDLDVSALGRFELVAARQAGPHDEPIEWRPATPIALTNGMTLPPIPERLRISAWTPAVALVTKNAQGQAVFDANDRFTIDAGIRGSPCTGLDDVSVITTVFLTGDILDPSPTIAVDWAGDFPSVELNAIIRGNPKLDLDAIRLDLLQQTIATFHAKRVQVFAGFYVDTGNTVALGSSPAQDALTKQHAARLAELLDPAKNHSMAAFAQALVGFFDQRKLEIDGIWFDFEVASLSDKHAPRLRELVIEVARALGATGRYLAFASAHDQSGNIQSQPPGTPPGPPAMLAHFFSHPSSLARLPNVITRPMSYDGGRFKTVTQCYGHYQVLPQGLQIAVGVGNGKPNVDSDMVAAAPQIRANRCGLIHWAFQSSATYAAYAKTDAIMNKDAPPHGTFGQPIQGPLNRQRLQVIQDAITAARAKQDKALSVADDVVIPADAP